MKRIALLISGIALLTGITSSSCKKGCTSQNAVNKTTMASREDGTCRYSTATFYASAGAFNGVPITRIDVYINGLLKGSMPGSIFYPAGLPNCFAQGTVSYTFPNGNGVSWTATVFLANNAVVTTEGQVAPLASTDCLLVNVTR